MALPPEILFHRRFQRLHRKEDRERYRGKADLHRLRGEPLPVTLLENLQLMLNEALAAEQHIPDHVDHDPFHFDYIDSDEPNALAFCSDGHSFIGVTIPLLNQLWRSASRVAESASVAALLDMRLSHEQQAEMSVEQRIAVAAFRLELLFIVLHDWTHVVHGHVRGGPDGAVLGPVKPWATRGAMSWGSPDSVKGTEQQRSRPDWSVSPPSVVALLSPSCDTGVSAQPAAAGAVQLRTRGRRRGLAALIVRR